MVDQIIDLEFLGDPDHLKAATLFPLRNQI